MKKLVLFVMAVMAFAGMSVAQDIWSVGYYEKSNGLTNATLYKNGSLQYSRGNNTQNFEAVDVISHNGSIYWAYSNLGMGESGKSFIRVGTSDEIYLLPDSDDSQIKRLIHANGLYGIGRKKIGGVWKAVCWYNNQASPYYTMGTGSYPSCAYGGVVLPPNGNFMCGFQFTSSSAYHGVIWHNNDVFHTFPENTKIYDMAYYEGYLYSVGTAIVDGSTYLRVWKTKWDNSSDSGVFWTLSTDAIAVERMRIYIDDTGDIYVNSCIHGSSVNPDVIYKNNSQYASTSSLFTSVVVNTNGVYYSGSESGGRIWKDGSYYLSPSNCTRINAMIIDGEPECTNSQVRSLPFTEGFENSSTSWPCWTKIDVDGNNGTDYSYWRRAGKRLASMTGNYCARHRSHTAASQDGWLITPRLFLQPLQGETKLTFKSLVTGSYHIKVCVSLDPDPTHTASFTQVLGQQQSNGTQTVTVDLKDYQGKAIYIGFRYTGILDYSWDIDDVNVAESFSPCAATNAPYPIDFSSATSWDCWTALDVDMAPQYYNSNPANIYAGTWQYNATAGYDGTGCVYHHYGPSAGGAQTGWLFSRRVTLPTGNYNYTLSFKSKTTSSGTGRKSTVWLAQNESGAPVVSHFTTKLWEDPAYSEQWTTYTVDLTPYKGKTVTIGFKYEGTYAHNWYLDDFAITKEVAQYTVTANVNNAAYGTVSGGGSFDPGATCVLHATPNSGYVFQNWKKNGSVVSNNPDYSFTVNESATYTAYFGEAPVTYYTINTDVTPAGAGTVTGGGMAAAGSSVTLTATANPGYTFSRWQEDSSTENPRTITVTGDATYTAVFTQNTYTITTNVTPAGSGTVTGGGSNFHYNDVATLTATPSSSNYEFAGWQDGNTENPRSVTVVGNATYTATFNEVGTTMFNVTASVEPAGAGTVMGPGTYVAGTDITMQAIANPGYTFSHWQDGVTTNPRPVTVTNDMSFTAYFTSNQYVITVLASPANGGTVGGGGSYYYGTYATLTATAASGYEFQGWSDGSTENPHQVLVTGNATYTATFGISGTTYYTVSGYVSPAGAGTVNGTGSFAAGSSTTLEAIANTGYTFSHWNDGVTSNPRTVTVNNNMSFTAYFTTGQYTLTVNASPAAGGTVTGGGSYAYGASATLTATPNTGYTFLHWNDGITANPRTVTVTGNATYTALFLSSSGETYTLTVTSGAPLLGQVTGSGVYPAGSAASIRAIPASYARFVKWNDNNTDNPRTVLVNSDLEFIAEFVMAQQYTITVESSNDNWGYVLGGGTFNEGTQIEISAIPNTGYMFTGWNDGNIENPRTITVSGDATYTAQFAESSMTTYNLQLICNSSEGSVSGGGTYIGGSTVTIQAFPAPGYIFTKWSDESTQNPRTVTVNSDMILVAFFATGVDENAQSNVKVYPNPAKESIRLIGIEANSQVEIYNSLGELVKVVSVSENQEISVRDFAAGLYMVRCGNATLRFVKEQ